MNKDELYHAAYQMQNLGMLGGGHSSNMQSQNTARPAEPTTISNAVNNLENSCADLARINSLFQEIQTRLVGEAPSRPEKLEVNDEKNFDGQLGDLWRGLNNLQKNLKVLDELLCFFRTI
jgi:hypothetical protein